MDAMDVENTLLSTMTIEHRPKPQSAKVELRSKRQEKVRPRLLRARAHALRAFWALCAMHIMRQH